MAVDTEHTLHWSSAAGDNATMLEQLQPNILKGHVRDHLSVLFLHFDVQAEGRAFVRAVRGMMKSAKKHLEEARQFKSTESMVLLTSVSGSLPPATPPSASHPFPPTRSSSSQVA
jgi:deferrochelatase/peroxidase EfeB